MKLKNILLSTGILLLLGTTAQAKDIVYQWQLSNFPKHEALIPQTFLKDPFKSVQDPKTNEALWLWQLKEFDKLSKDEDIALLLKQFAPSAKIQPGEDILEWQLKEFKKVNADLTPETTFKEYSKKESTK